MIPEPYQSLIPPEKGAVILPIFQVYLAFNKTCAHMHRGTCILAPLTKGGNRAFRQLTTEFGCDVTMSEMAYARNLIK